jgi:hypothetical protein
MVFVPLQGAFLSAYSCLLRQEISSAVLFHAQLGELDAQRIRAHSGLAEGAPVTLLV